MVSFRPVELLAHFPQPQLIALSSVALLLGNVSLAELADAPLDLAVRLVDGHVLVLERV